MMEKLYELAFAYRKTKVWKKLWDNQLFAIELPGGGVGYCSIMGRAGEHVALGLYPGEDGLQSYCLAAEAAEEDSIIRQVEKALAQNCVMCSFENKDGLWDYEIKEVKAYCAAHSLTLRGQHVWPKFQRVLPRHLPWTMQEETDRAWMAAALEAGLEVAQQLASKTAAQLGLQSGAPFDRDIPLLVKTDTGYDWRTTALPPRRETVYPEAGIIYDLPLKRAAATKRRTEIWVCDIISSIQPVSDEENLASGKMPHQAPYFPWLQIVYDMFQDCILDCAMCPEREDYTEFFPNRLLDLMEKFGRPRKLLVTSDRSAALYARLAARLGINYQHGKCEALEEAIEDMFQHLGPNGTDAEGGPDELEQDGAYPEQLLLNILRNCEDFSGFPDEAIYLFANLAEKLKGQIPKSQLLLLQKEIHKRFD